MSGPNWHFWVVLNIKLQWEYTSTTLVLSFRYRTNLAKYTGDPPDYMENSGIYCYQCFISTATGYFSQDVPDQI